MKCLNRHGDANAIDCGPFTIMSLEVLLKLDVYDNMNPLAVCVRHANVLLVALEQQAEKSRTLFENDDASSPMA